jgi:serine phosphatase RsbU (regulator of sigma subunit)
LLYTDGIAEARSGAVEDSEDIDVIEYGVEGLEKLVRRGVDAAPRALIDAVLADVDRYCSPRAPHDDCTMIALRYHGHDG